MKPQRPASRAFTLMELLIVIGLITALSALVLRGFSNNSGTELRQAESSLSAQLALARANAIRLGRPVRFVVNLDSADLDKRYALVAIVAQDPSSGAWNILNEPMFLSAQVRIVPESSVPTVSGLTWPNNVVSRWTGTMALTIAGLPAGNFGYLEFSASGGIFGSPKVAFSTINRLATSIEFNSATQVRCYLVRGSGVATLFKEAASIP